MPRSVTTSVFFQERIAWSNSNKSPHTHIISSVAALPER